MVLKPEEVRNMTGDEINNRIASIKEELFKLQSEQKAGRIEKPHRMGYAKKEIARLYTILKEKKGAEK